jgi:hypothetical protein
MPNCTEESGTHKIEFGRLGRRVVEGRFDGGSMTSDGGVMLLSEVDRKIGLMQAASRCIADPRSPLLIKHGVRDMLRQRVYGLALGWEDLSDHGALRQDVAIQTAVGVDREVASAPTLCRLEKWADRATAWRLHEVLVDQFIASFKTAPEELVLDFDATDNPLHGQQEGRFFHGYYDCYCYLPDKHRDTYGVEPICKVLQIAPSGYRRHAACQRKPELRCARAKTDDSLMPQIQQVWQSNMQVYGADKVWHQMNREGIQVARCTVERLMKRLGLQGARRGKVIRTTVPDTSAIVRWTGSIASSRPIVPTNCGCRTSRTSRHGRAGSTWPL